MNNQEAIAMLKRIQEPEAWEPQINQAAFEALDMAIEALELFGNSEQLPSAQPKELSCDGCKFCGQFEHQFPCKVCIRREKDYYARLD